MINKSLFFLLALFFMSLPRVSLAQDWSACYSDAIGDEVSSAPQCPNRQVAYEQAQALCERRSSQTCVVHATWAGAVRFRTTSDQYTTLRFWNTANECPAGSVWDDSKQECSMDCPGGYASDPFNPGQCTNQQSCLARNSMPGFLGVGGQAKPFTNRCVGGCDYRAVGAYVSVGAAGGNIGLTSGNFEFTGNGCESSQEEQNVEDAQQTKPQECIPSPVRTCVKPDGKICMASSSGKQFCWQQGETGTKTDGPNMQVRNAGDTAIPPVSQLPNGDSLSQQGSSQTTTTTTKDAAGNVVVIVTTTTTNYETQNGTNASGGDDGQQGEPSSGDGKPGKDGDTSASGGGDCDTPPIVTGDAALNMVATQAWATRCAVEAGNAADVVGDIANCGAAFLVEGDNANAIKLRAMRKQICPMEGETTPDPASYIGDAGDPSEVWEDGDEEGTPLDTSGFGYGTTCPTLPQINIYGHVLEIDPEGKFCSWMHLGGTMLLIVVGIICLRIVGTS